MRPKISIITVSYNQGEFLAEALESVLGQGYPNLEHIVVDGGSTDGSVDTIRSYDENIHYWISEPDNGQSEALNKGFQQTTGDIIGWLNSDDTYRPGTLHAVAEAFRDPRVQIAMSEKFAYIQSDGIAYASGVNSFVDHQALVRFWRTGGMTINQPCVFFRRELFMNVGGSVDETLEFAMDYDLWLRLTRHASIKIVPGTWANYRLHDKSKSGRGFRHFYPEWRRVSRRFWGTWYSPVFYRHYFNYLLCLILSGPGMHSAPYSPPVFDFDADYRIKGANPKVSVIITNYNYGRFVDAAIESALNQDYENLEVIVVDDGSEDNSREAIEGFNGRITTVFKENGGQASAFNAGVARATGDILCFLDADDIWDSSKVRRVIEKYLEAPWGLVCHDLTAMTHDGEIRDPGLYSSSYFGTLQAGNLFNALVKNAFPWVFSPTSGMSIPASLAEKIFPLPEGDWRICADTPLAYAAAYLAPVGALRQPLGRYRTHESSHFFSHTHSDNVSTRTMAIVGPLKVAYFLRNQFRELRDFPDLDPMKNYWFFRRWCLIATRHPWVNLPSLYRMYIVFVQANPQMTSPGFAVVQMVLDTLIALAIVLRLPIRHKYFRRQFRSDLKAFDDLTTELLFPGKTYFSKD